MPAMDDDQARALLEEIKQRNRDVRARQLAEAKAKASDKEPFDLAKLEALCDTSSEGRMDPEDVRRERFEHMYYVDYPGIKTLAELARKVEELAAW
jgi:hypothetical protein